MLEEEDSCNGLLVTGHFDAVHPYSIFRENGRQDWLLIYTISGSGRFGYIETGSQFGEVLTGSGDLTLIRPGALHDYGVAKKSATWDFLWVHFCPRPHWYTWLKWPESPPPLMMLNVDTPYREHIQSRLEDAHRLAIGAGEHREAMAMNALEEVILRCDARNPNAQSSLLDPRVMQTMEFLCHNLHETVSTPMLAMQRGLSSSRLTHLFREQTGLTPQQFLEMQRLNRACQLLELTSRSIEDISEEVGFNNPFYFSLRFKRHIGLSPRDYRKRKWEIHSLLTSQTNSSE